MDVGSFGSEIVDPELMDRVSWMKYSRALDGVGSVACRSLTSTYRLYGTVSQLFLVFVLSYSH
jgi:hypothetical protein